MSNPFAQQVQRQQQSAFGGGGRKSYDMLVEVQGYEQVNGQTAMKAKLLETTKAAHDGYPAEVSILTERGRTPNPSTTTYDGSAIDSEMMPNHLTPGMTVIVQGARLSKDSDEVYARRVTALPGQNINKVVEGTFTVSGNESRGEVWHIQRWPRQATTAEDFFNDVNKAVFDQQIANHQAYREAVDNNTPKPPIKPTLGVSFRVINENNEVVNYIPPVTLRGKDDGGGPISMDDVKAGYEWYREQMGDEARIEIIPVQQYRVSSLSGRGGQSIQRDMGSSGATATMLKTSGRISPEGDIPRFGNMALGGPGIAQLSPGQAKAVAGKVELVGAENDVVNDLTVSGQKFPVQQLVKDARGNEVTMHESMDKDNGLNYKQSADPRQEASSSQKQSAEDEAAAGPEQAGAVGGGVPDDMNGIEDDLDAAFDSRASAGPKAG